MDTKEKTIIELLEQGKSYKYIQEALNVSPSTIAQVKKEYFSSEATTTSTTDAIVAPTCSATNDSNCSEKHREPFKDLFNNPKNNNNMKNYYYNDDDELEDSEKVSLEKMRLEMAHELELKKIEKESQELNFKLRELKIKEEQAYSEKRKTEKQGRSLIFRFRKQAEKIEDGEWTYGEIDKYYSKIIDLKEEIEKYCFENDIETDDLSILVILEKMESEFESLLDEDADADDCTDVEFDDDMKEMPERAKEYDFESYE